MRQPVLDTVSSPPVARELQVLQYVLLHPRRIAVAMRTVRLDQEAEEALQAVVGATGLSASAALKQGILALRRQLSCQPSTLPYEIYAALDVGPGGYARAPSTETRRAVQEAIKEKLGR
jgi:hypothetical protein